MIDLISNDLTRIAQVPVNLLNCMGSLVEIPVAVFLMVYLIGWQSLMGVLFIFATTPYIYAVLSVCGKIRKQIAEVSDQRILLMEELVSGIRVLKTHAWEDSYKEKVKVLRRLVKLDMSASALFHSVPLQVFVHSI